MMAGDKNVQSQGEHLSFSFLNLNKLYYLDKVIVSIKGLELELVKILTIFTCIDFSRNNFIGEIPDSIGNLTALYVLSFSHNRFSGKIPSSIGHLSNLGSVDLSVNNLTGEIPSTLIALTFLSFLNLSNNNLTGEIPRGAQFQTFSADAFESNPLLCGFPLNTSCGDLEHCGDTFDTTCIKTIPTSSGMHNLVNEFDWMYIFIGLGVVVGAANFFLALAYSRKGRDWYDKNLHKMFVYLFPS